MDKKIISYFLILLFAAFITAPTLSIFSKSIDSSIFYSLNEEDTTSNENLKVFKVYNTENTSLNSTFSNSEIENSHTFYLILYTSFVTECISPPPELI